MKLYSIFIATALSAGIVHAQEIKCSQSVANLEACQAEMETLQNQFDKEGGGSKASKATRDSLGAKSDECTQLEGIVIQKCKGAKELKLQSAMKSAERNLQHKKEKEAKEEDSSKKYERMAEEHNKKVKEKAAKQKAADEAEAAFDALPDANGKVDSDAKLKQAADKNSKKSKSKSIKDVKSLK